MSDPPDDQTVPSRRTAARGAISTGAPGETMRAEPNRRRETYEPVSDDGGPADTQESARGDVTIEGSTIIAHRESRRRATRSRAEPDAAGTTPGLIPVPAQGTTPGTAAPGTRGRLASVPDPTDREAYAARSAEPVRAVREVPPARARRTPVDGAAVSTAQHRRGRRTALIVIFAAGAVAFAAAASLIAIMLNP